jgi:hypothetical protein
MALFITRQVMNALSAWIKDASTSTRDLITFRGEIPAVSRPSSGFSDGDKICVSSPRQQEQ